MYAIFVEMVIPRMQLTFIYVDSFKFSNMFILYGMD